MEGTVGFPVEVSFSIGWVPDYIWHKVYSMQLGVRVSVWMPFLHAR